MLCRQLHNRWLVEIFMTKCPKPLNRYTTEKCLFCFLIAGRLYKKPPNVDKTIGGSVGSRRDFY